MIPNTKEKYCRSLITIAVVFISSKLSADNGIPGAAEGFILGGLSSLLFLAVIIFGCYGLLVLLKPVIGTYKKTRRKDLWKMILLIILFPITWLLLENNFGALERCGVRYTNYEGVNEAVLILFAVLGAFVGYLILPAKEVESDPVPKDLLGKLRIKGRIRRKHFIALQIATLIFLYLIHLTKASPIGSLVLSSTGTLLFCAGVIFDFVITARRLQDCELNPLYSFALLVPYVNIFLILFLCIKPGQSGENKYGADPRTTTDTNKI